MLSRLERSKNLAAVANFQRRLEYDCGPLNLLGNDRRRMLFSGPVGSKKIHLFLLSDMIIIAKGPYLPNNTFKATGPRIDLTDKSFNLKVDRKVLHLGTSKDVHFKSKEELHVWHSRISDALLEILASSMFGSPLGAGRNGQAIPPVVIQCIRCLATPEIMSTKGLFRLSGTKGSVDRIKAAFDRGTDPRLADPSISPHDIAALLKQFFRELPISLIPQDSFQTLLALGGELEDGAKPEQFELLAKILNPSAAAPASSSSVSAPSISSPHILTLRFLLEFLKALATFSPVNMMTSHNIAIVFTPNILRPAKSQDPEDHQRNGWNKAIEQQLKKDARQLKNTLKLLLLGAGDTGKSTFLKQVNILHGKDSIGADAENKKILNRNIIFAVQALIVGCETLGILLSPENQVRAIQLCELREIDKAISPQWIEVCLLS